MVGVVLVVVEIAVVVRVVVPHFVAVCNPVMNISSSRSGSIRTTTTTNATI